MSEWPSKISSGVRVATPRGQMIKTIFLGGGQDDWQIRIDYCAILMQLHVKRFYSTIDRLC